MSGRRPNVQRIRDTGPQLAHAAYVRVSSKTQSYDTQRDALERHAAAHGRRLGVWYVETRTATKRAPRPELERLLADARAGRLASVSVFRLDRFTRLGVADTLGTLDALRDSGVAVHFVSDGLPSIEPGDVNSVAAAIREAVLAVMAACARIEGLARSERVSAARERIEAEGGAWGRPRALAETDVARARQLRAEGLTVREVAQRLGVKRSTLGRALTPEKKR